MMDISSPPKTWQEAFAHQNIPTIRATEKQLRAGISRDKEKLRVIVGGNYRDLLATADRITALEIQLRTAETQISTTGQNCKPPQHEERLTTTSTPANTAAQAFLLSKCNLCATVALSSGQVLLSAKLTAISRLLLRSLTETSQPNKISEQLRKKASTLRRRLLRYIGSELTHPATSPQGTVEALCGYCLITSTSSSEAVRHFQTLRLEKLQRRCDGSDHGVNHIRETFQYLVSSIESLESILGRAFNDLLANLQRQPILEDSGVGKLEALSLDQVKGLIPTDILTFTPYIKRVTLTKSEVGELVKDWSSEASSIFMNGLSRALTEIRTVPNLLSLRKELLSIILPVYFSTHAQVSLLDGIRQAVHDRLVEIYKYQTEAFLQIGRELASSSQKPTSSSSPWQPSPGHSNIRSEGPTFLHELQGRHLGTIGGLGKQIRRMKAWAGTFRELRDSLQNLHSIRWRDMIEEPDEENEEVGSTIISQLSIEDPDLYLSHIDRSLAGVVSEFESLLQSATNNVLNTKEPDPERVTFLLRALRESSVVITDLVSGHQSTQAETYTKLYGALALNVTKAVSSKFENRTQAETHAERLHNDLPSPLTFSFLRETCKVMVDMGGIDIWTRTAVRICKGVLCDAVLAEDREKFYVQNSFDRDYLRTALKMDVSEPDQKVSDEVSSEAVAYWNRTKLLFGVLA